MISRIKGQLWIVGEIMEYNWTAFGLVAVGAGFLGFWVAWVIQTRKIGALKYQADHKSAHLENAGIDFQTLLSYADDLRSASLRITTVADEMAKKASLSKSVTRQGKPASGMFSRRR
jgi:NAD(P)H-nitrite reductase large subunit